MDNSCQKAILVLNDAFGHCDPLTKDFIALLEACVALFMTCDIRAWVTGLRSRVRVLVVVDSDAIAFCWEVQRRVSAP